MIAPPRPPAHDELEALIKEARERQLRRRLLGAAGVAIAAAIGLSVYALNDSHGGRTVLSDNASGAGAPECRASQLSATAGLNGATGTMLGSAMLTNTSATPCSLPSTSPQVSIFWRGRQMPARQEGFSDSGGIPVRVLAPGAAAFVHMGWAEWCGKPSAGTLIRPTFRLRFGGLEVAARAHVMTPPRCDVPGTEAAIRVGRPVRD
jgi:hypothetical protein